MSAGEQSLSEFLAQRARAASDSRLVLDASLGLTVAALAVLFRPKGWLLLLGAGLCFAAYGGWGIADRELRDHPKRWLRAARGAAAVVGAIAALLLILTVLGAALGTWIS